MIRFLISTTILIALHLQLSCILEAQELEPRSYSPSPVGANFLLLGYAYSSGDVTFDPSVPITDVEANIDTFVSGYARTFDLFGHMASVGAVLPYINPARMIFDKKS